MIPMANITHPPISSVFRRIVEILSTGAPVSDGNGGKVMDGDGSTVLVGAGVFVNGLAVPVSG